MTIEHLARVCYEAHVAFCVSIGDNSQESWGNAHAWQRGNAIKQMKFHLTNPDIEVSRLHDEWITYKVLHGWTYGERKSVEYREHPFMVPFHRLPVEVQVKYCLYQGITNSLAKFIK